MAALIGTASATLTLSDVDDTTPQPNQADSGTATASVAPIYSSFLWPVLGLYPGKSNEIVVSGESRESWGVIS